MHLTVPSTQGRPVPNGKITYKEFLEWMDEDTHAEWVNGEIVFMAPISGEHNDVSGFLYGLVREFVAHGELGKVRFEPFQMKTGPRLPGRSPDLLFVAKRNLRRLKKTYLDGPADLVVEVISPDRRRVDREQKYREYEKGGVKEYWLIDPERRQAEFFELGPQKRFQLASLRDGAYHSRILKGVWLKPEWLWRDPLPTVRWVFKQWGID